MAALIIKEGLDEDSQPKKHLNPRWTQQKHKHKQAKKKKITQDEDEDDNEDSDFLDSGSNDKSSSDSESDGSNGSVIPNDEVHASLLLPILYSPGFSL